MRVLIVHPGIYVYGGAELVITKLANFLTKNGIKNALLTTSIIPEMRKDLAGTEIIIQKKPKISPFVFILDLNEIIALYIGMRNNIKNFDVINVHNFPAELAMFAQSRPVIWMCNEPVEVYFNTDFNASKVFFRKILKKIVLTLDKFIVSHCIRHVVVADEINAERFKSLYGFNPEIISYGIDYDFFSKGERKKAIQEFDLADNFIILQVGMFTPFKNQIESVKTVEKLKSKIPNIKLILAGGGEKEYIAVLEGYIKEHNLENEVIITTHLNREEIRDLYHATDVLLHPIRAQGGWLAPFEALCAQKPVIVSPEMSASAIIKNEAIGIVTNSYAETILKIYNEPQEYSAMARKGKIWVKENLSWDRFCDRMTNMFHQIGRHK